MKKFLRVGLLSLVVMAGLLISGYLVFLRNRPPGKMPIGVATTHVVEPFDERGEIDFEAALNKRMSEGATPETNAAVLLWQAEGPTLNLPDDYFDWLGVARPPRDGEYFVNWYKFHERQYQASRSYDLITVERNWKRAKIHPWRAAEFPACAEFLALNDRPLELVVAATRRPHYFDPLISRDDDGDRWFLLRASAPISYCNVAPLCSSDALAARSMLRIGEADWNGAWQDLLACHRLARLLARGATIGEGLTAYRMDAHFRLCGLAYLAAMPRDAYAIRRCLDDLRALPPLPSLADKVDFTERLFCLEAIQRIRWEGADSLRAWLYGKELGWIGDVERDGLAAADWENALRETNRWFDRSVAALRQPLRRDSIREIGLIDAELKALGKRAESVDSLAEGLGGFLTSPRATIAREEAFSVVYMSLPALQPVRDAHDRDIQGWWNFGCALALEAYRLDKGHYPATLEALAPDYLGTAPMDLFADRPLVYRIEANGYVLYSVGPNGQDDEGRGISDTPFGDDLRVRMPPEEPK